MHYYLFTSNWILWQRETLRFLDISSSSSYYFAWFLSFPVVFWVTPGARCCQPDPCSAVPCTYPWSRQQHKHLPPALSRNHDSAAAASALSDSWLCWWSIARMLWPMWQQFNVSANSRIAAFMTHFLSLRFFILPTFSIFCASSNFLFPPKVRNSEWYFELEMCGWLWKQQLPTSKEDY